MRLHTGKLSWCVVYFEGTDVVGMCEEGSWEGDYIEV